MSMFLTILYRVEETLILYVVVSSISGSLLVLGMDVSGFDVITLLMVSPPVDEQPANKEKDDKRVNVFNNENLFIL